MARCQIDIQHHQDCGVPLRQMTHLVSSILPFGWRMFLLKGVASWTDRAMLVLYHCKVRRLCGCSEMENLGGNVTVGTTDTVYELDGSRLIQRADCIGICYQQCRFQFFFDSKARSCILG